MTAGHDIAVRTIGTEPSVSVRRNPFKRPLQDPGFLEGAAAVPWCDEGFILKSRPSFTLDPLFHAGAYYVQDSSAMYVGHVFRKVLDTMHFGKGIRVLDLCAAPGGKTTDASASLRTRFGDDFTLVSNEVMRQRAGILRDNVAIWGDPAVAVTSVDPSAFAQMPDFFDVIIADVPCSGEGMFRKDPRAVQEWSEENVHLCSARQKRILGDVWPALREGGVLIYSTCTFEEEENDGIVSWAARELGAETISAGDDFDGIRSTETGKMLVPGEVPGEGQFCAALIRTSASRSHGPAVSLDRLRPLRNGVREGEIKGGTLIPDADWALSLNYDRSRYPQVEVDRDTALHFLHRDCIRLTDAPKGYILLTYKGLALGFVKNLGNRCNNLHPQARRIRMDIDNLVEI